jgi:ribose transport system permease protein
LVGALVLCVVCCLVIGLVNGLLVEGLGLNALVVTLAMGQLVAGGTRLYRGDVLTTSNVPPKLADLAGANLGGVSYLLIAAAVGALVATFFVHRAVAGRRLVASSAAPRAATLAGVRSPIYRVLAYAMASVTYGIGGMLAAGYVGTPDLTLGDPYLLSSIVAVVLGGAVLTGGRVAPVATLLGTIFITVLDYDLRVLGLSSGWRMAIQGIVLAAALTIVFLLRNAPAARTLVGRLVPRTASSTLKT